MESCSVTTLHLLHRLRNGDESARAELIGRAQNRLCAIATRMLRNYPHVARWEQAEDVLQSALVRLHKALVDVPPVDKQHFFRLSTLQIRRTLIDLARHYDGPEGLGRNHETKLKLRDDSIAPPSHERFVDANEPQSLDDWTQFHECVARLPADERQVFELLWYQGLTQEEAAEVLNLSDRTVRRHWTAARLSLAELLGKGDLS